MTITVHDTTSRKAWDAYRESGEPGIKPEFLGTLVCQAGLQVEEVSELAWRKFGGDWPAERLLLR